MPIWNLLRPAPRYAVPSLLKIDHGENQPPEYVMVHVRRYGRLDGDTKRQWIYNGVILFGYEGHVAIMTGIVGIRERDLSRPLSLWQLQHPKKAAA